MLGHAGVMRIYLSGDIILESATCLVGEAHLPGVQGKIVLAMLVARHGQPVTAEELADELWGEARPPAWEVGLRALLSKIRGAIAPVMPAGWVAIRTVSSGYQFRLPPDARIDVEVAHQAVHDAETALQRGAVQEAGSAALTASMITRRPFLMEAQGPWATAQRDWLEQLRVRSLEVLSSVWTALGDHEQAARDAQAAVRLDPYRETAYRKLMLAHVAAGNPALAVEAYQSCARRLRDDLDVLPALPTRAIYDQVRCLLG
jgi:DNA-binding SARP family transcriptional activator